MPEHAKQSLIEHRPSFPDLRAPPAAQGGQAQITRLLGGLGLGVVAVTLVILAVIHGTATLMDDEFAHLLIARDAWVVPHLIFNEWGRTLNTLIYMPAAPLSLLQTRLLVVAMSVVCAGLAWRVARLLGVRFACLVPLLLLVQPQFHNTAWMALTQQPLILLGLLAAGLTLSGHWRWGALLVGALPLVRYETLPLVALFGLLCLYKRQWWGCALLTVPLLLNHLLAFLFFGDLPLAIFFKPRPDKALLNPDTMILFRYLKNIAGAPILALVLLGLIEALAKPRLLLFFSFTGLYFLTHLLISRLGLFNSPGYWIYLTPTAPGLAIVAAQGLEAVCVRMTRNLRIVLRIALPRESFALALGTCVVLALGASVFLKYAPYPLYPEDAAINKAVEYLKGSDYRDAPVVASHVRFFYLTGRRIPINDLTLLWYAKIYLDAVAPGTLLFWDTKYSDGCGAQRARLEGPQSGWKKVWSSGTAGADLAAFYQKEKARNAH